MAANTGPCRVSAATLLFASSADATESRPTGPAIHDSLTNVARTPWSDPNAANSDESTTFHGLARAKGDLLLASEVFDLKPTSRGPRLFVKSGDGHHSGTA